MGKPAARCQAAANGTLVCFAQRLMLLTLAVYCFSATVFADSSKVPFEGAEVDAVAAIETLMVPQEDLFVVEPVLHRQGRRLLKGMHKGMKGMHRGMKGMRRGMKGMHRKRRRGMHKGMKGMHKGMKGMHGKKGVVRSGTPGYTYLTASDFNVDYSSHMHQVAGDGSISMILDHESGVRLSSKLKYQYGTYSFDVKGPWPDTSGFVSAIYLSDGKQMSTEIDWEFIGSGPKSGLQTNIYVDGIGGNEHKPKNTYAKYDGFRPDFGFNTYSIEWAPSFVSMYINGDRIRTYTTANTKSGTLPQVPMTFYMSIWKARWAGKLQFWKGELRCQVKNIRFQPWKTFA